MTRFAPAGTLTMRSAWSVPAWLVDVALAAVVGLTAFLVLLTGPPGASWRAPDRVTVVLVGLGVLPYLLRSRAPLAAVALAGVSIVALTEHGDALGVLGGGAFFLVYAVAARAPRRHVVIAAVMVGVLLAYLWARSPERMPVATLLNNVLLFTGAFAAGDWGRRRREQATWAQERARLVELDRTRAASQAVTEERLRIARDLHDITAHTLGVIAVQAGVAAHVIDAEPGQARIALTSIAQVSRDALAEIRDIVGALRTTDQPGYTPTPRIADLPALVDELRAAGQDVELRLGGAGPGGGPVASAGIEVAAYRVVQQALSNALRHAAGAVSTVVLERTDAGLTVTVRNGPGCATAGAPGGAPAYGLTGMAERVHLAGGTMCATRTDGGGFEVVATFPAGRRP